MEKWPWGLAEQTPQTTLPRAGVVSVDEKPDCNTSRSDLGKQTEGKDQRYSFDEFGTVAGGHMRKREV